MINTDETQGASNQYTPFYHEKCPRCGFCKYCGRYDEPFKDHWTPQPYIGDPIPPPYTITWTAGTDNMNVDMRQHQAVIPSYNAYTAETYADVA